MLREILLKSFASNQSLLVTISRLFLTFSIACIGSYSRDYLNLVRKNQKINIVKVIICAILPSFISLYVFDGLLSTMNKAAILIVSFILGYLGHDLLKYIQKINIRGIVRLALKFLTFLDNNINSYDDEDKKK